MFSNIVKADFKNLPLFPVSRINKKQVGLRRKVSFVLMFFVAAKKLSTFRILNKNTVRPHVLL